MNNHVTHLHTAPSSPSSPSSSSPPAAAAEEPAILPGTLPYGEPESGSGGSGGGVHPDAVRAAVTADLRRHGHRSPRRAACPRRRVAASARISTEGAQQGDDGGNPDDG